MKKNDSGKPFYRPLYRYEDAYNRRPLEIVDIFPDQLKIYDPCSKIKCLTFIMVTTKLEPYIVFDDKVYWLNRFVVVQEDDNG